MQPAALVRELDALRGESRWAALGRAFVATPVRASLTGKALEAATLLALATVVPRLLGPSRYGEFAVALSIVMIGSLVMSPGGPTMLTRFVPSAPKAERAEVARALLARLVRWRAASLALAAVVAVVLVAAAPSTFPPLVTGLVLVALVFEVLGTLGFQVALALGHARLWSFRWPLQNVTLMAGAVALGSVAGATGAIAALAIGYGAAFAVAWSAVAGRLRDAPRGVKPPHGAMRFAAVNASAAALAHLYQRGGPVAVALLGGSSAQAGFAGLAVGLALALMYTVSQAFAVQLPSLAELADSDRAGAEAVSRRLAAHAQLVLLPFALCCALGSEQLVRLVYGGAFHGAAQAMIPALAVLPLAPLSAQAGQVAALRLQPMRWLVATALGAATFVGVAALAVPAHGATGATLALLAAMAAAIVGAAVALPRCFGRPGLVAGLGGAALVLGCLALL